MDAGRGYRYAVATDFGSDARVVLEAISGKRNLLTCLPDRFADVATLRARKRLGMVPDET